MPIPEPYAQQLADVLKGQQPAPLKIVKSEFEKEDPGFQKFLLGLMAAAGILIYLIFRR